MDARTREVLEFDRVLDLIAGRAASPLGREFILALEPATDAAEVARRTAPLHSLLRLYAENAQPPLGGLFDARPLLDRAAIEGSVLDEEAWPRIAVLLDVCARLCRWREEHRERHKPVFEVLELLTTDESLSRTLARMLDKDGRIRDDATPELAAARRAVSAAMQRVLKTVQRLTHEWNSRGVLSDGFSTVRNDRYVLPVRAGSRGRVSGILHGSSASGETMYIEPAEVVEASNEAEAFRDAERREVLRILQMLTAQLRAWLPEARHSMEILQRFDGLCALARTANERGWNIPNVVASGPVRLFAAHHPLLNLTTPGKSVPIEMLLGRDDRIVVLSGPNAGGKTTAMKTLGLLALLAACGSPIPAFPDSALPIFGGIVADIGDQQNLTEGLSTFTGHVRRIRNLWDRSGPRTLVILDELGTGTDPHEGGALAVALLEGFLGRAGLTVTTSHFNTVKQWAEDTPGVRNASFSLDPQTRAPTFRLRLDIPGASEALDIAEREGMPASVLARARELVGERHLQMGELLRRIEERERTLAAASMEAEARARSLAEQEALARTRADRLRDERREWKVAALAEKQRMMAETRAQLESMIAALPSEEELARRKAMLAAQRAELARMQSMTAEERRKHEEHQRLAALLPVKGQKVYHRGLAQWGEVQETDAEGKRIRILVGMIEVNAKLDDLLERDPREVRQELEAERIAAEAALGRKKPKKSKRIKNALRSAEEYSLPTAPAARTAFQNRPGFRISTPDSMTLDLHGYRVDEALGELDRFLDRSLLASFPYVKINHGTGTGRLYQAVHEYLRTHPAVQKYRFANPDEGGGGVTVVEL